MVVFSEGNCHVCVQRFARKFFQAKVRDYERRESWKGVSLRQSELNLFGLVDDQSQFSVRHCEMR
jgi:hypothetical protein